MAGRVGIALDDAPFEPTPTYTWIDEDYENLVALIEISRGRQTESDRTDTSTSVLHLNDTVGVFDPNNTSSPYFGRLDGRPIAFFLWNPVTSAWVQQWRGVIDDYGHNLHPATNAGVSILSNVQVQCVDMFDYLTRVEMIPGLFGDPLSGGASEGVVFYEDTDVQTRFDQLLADAQIPGAMTVVFTGNVNVQETRYDPGDSLLVALRDAADAEFPDIANIYTDKLGRFVFHGRMARFEPETTRDSATPGAWVFTRWKAGDGAAIDLDGDRAQIRPPLTWSRPRSRIVNAAMCYPRFPIRGTGAVAFTEADIPGQIYVDPGYSPGDPYYSWSAPDLLTLEGTTTGNDAKDECKLFAQFKVANNAEPRTRVEALTFRSIRPDDPRAAATWALICGADISDIVDLVVGYPGGEGLAENFYIEGSQMTIAPLAGDYDDVTLTLNVSPEYLEDVFTP